MFDWFCYVLWFLCFIIFNASFIKIGTKSVVFTNNLVFLFRPLFIKYSKVKKVFLKTTQKPPDEFKMILFPQIDLFIVLRKEKKCFYETFFYLFNMWTFCQWVELVLWSGSSEPGRHRSVGVVIKFTPVGGVCVCLCVCGPMPVLSTQTLLGADTKVTACSSAETRMLACSSADSVTSAAVVMVTPIHHWIRLCKWGAADCCRFCFILFFLLWKPLNLFWLVLNYYYFLRGGFIPQLTSSLRSL